MAILILQVEYKMPKLVKPAETEKVTVNLGFVDLGRIDLLVEEGFYTNRTDFIRTAIRAHLGTHAEAVGRIVDKRTLDIGLRDFSRADLEAARDAGERLHIKVVGLARLSDDIPVALARETIGSITVLGALQARNELRAALSDRIT